MVEMLGVLAIMGIVGMVGVKMYTNAMNKHRANELIYEAQKRATMVAMQIASGQENLSITNFTNPTGYVFGVEKNPNNTNQFNITITGVDSKVCEHMKTAVGPATPIRVISEFCNKLTFNNDLSTAVYASDIQNATECANAGNTWCGGSSVCVNTENDCCVGKQPEVCQSCSAGAITTTSAEGSFCDYNHDGNANDGVCHFGVCQQESTDANCVAGGVRCNDATYGVCCPVGYLCTTNGDTPGTCVKFASGCTTNADCTNSAKPYCYITGTDCYTPTNGYCHSLGTIKTVEIEGVGRITIGNSMSWWSARNWCEAQGKHLINVEDLQVYKSGTQTQITTGSGIKSSPCAKGKGCGDWSVAPTNAMWNGAVLTDAKDSNGKPYSARYSPIVLALAQAQKVQGLYWTGSDFDSSSCGAFRLHMSHGLIDTISRNNLSIVPICQ